MATHIIYSGPGDGAETANNADYLTARAATTATNTTSSSGTVGNGKPTTNYSCAQCFLVLDTSAVPVGSGTGLFSINVSLFSGNVNADTIRFRQVSSVANKIAGASLAAQTPLLSDPGTFPAGTGRYTAGIPSAYVVPRSATFNVVIHTVGEENASVPPDGSTSFQIRMSEADGVGTTNDPYLQLDVGAAWEFVGVSNVVEVTTAAHALVTTGIAGTLAAGDLLVACISSRIASTTSITLPTGGEWTLVSEQKNNNTATNTSATPSGLMAYCVRGASNPNLTFTHPVAPSVAIGRIVAYRNVNGSAPKDTQTSFTTATNVTAVSGTGLTTTQIEDLIVAMTCGGQEAAWSSFNATDPAGASGATSTAAPTATWLERADSLTTTGADTSLAIFDAVKATSGATGNLTATASLAAAHVVIAGAFKIAQAAATGTGTPAGQSGSTAGVGISSSDGTGTPTGDAAAVSGEGTVASAGIDGTGAVAADAAVVSGAGVSVSDGTGVLVAQAATIAATGTIASDGTGALVAQASTVDGAGLSGSAGSGALQADAAVVAGTGISASAGTGSLVAGSAEVAGAGTAAAGNTGALVAQAATIAGLGVSSSVGSGALQAGAATVAGAGLVASTGTGALVAGSATVDGAGVVIDEGAIFGTGALVAGAATIAGAGEVTGEVAPDIPLGAFMFGRVAVEGYGVAVLPELEAFGRGVVGEQGLASAVLSAPEARARGEVVVGGRAAAAVAIVARGIADTGPAGIGTAAIGLRAAARGGRVTQGRARVEIKLGASADGYHDPDEAVVMAFLLAA